MNAMALSEISDLDDIPDEILPIILQMMSIWYSI